MSALMSIFVHFSPIKLFVETFRSMATCLSKVG